ncbi:2-dehydropantoate 2-reductase [Siminovitchia sp. 179-K 8D1 HS]|uniref:2-dehydropantoate 2-reductase n=1 Tax=Siminovitchia sp. 179-K 8D1 HS TaxID=3142385 RepID=UPI0039A3AF6D
MKVGIIGGGSIGLLLAAYLGKFFDITVYTRTEEQARELGENGIQLITLSGERFTKVSASTESDSLNGQDFIFVAVKQYHLNDLIPVICKIASHVPICFLQNGMGHLEWLPSLPNETIFVATVEHGAKRKGRRTVAHNGVGKINIGLYRGDSRSDQKFPDCRDPEFPFQFHHDYEGMLVEKLIANVLINPLTVIFQAKNGVLVENPYYFQLFRQLFEEVYEVFPHGEKEKTFQKVIRICQNTKDNTSSMLKDVQEGRKTEIEAILGYVLRTALKKGMKPATIQAVYLMAKGIEQERS